MRRFSHSFANTDRDRDCGLCVDCNKCFLLSPSLLPDQLARMSPRPRESLADCELSDEALTTCYNRMKDLDGNWVSSSSGNGVTI